MTIQMTSASSLGSIIVIILLITLLIEDLVLGSARRPLGGWLTLFQLATAPLFFAFAFIMIARVIIMIYR